MTLAALLISLVAVLVSLAATYFSWRQTQAAEAQVRTAQTALARQIADARLTATPRFSAKIESRAANSKMYSIPTALLITNDSRIDLKNVQIQLHPTASGLNGFRMNNRVDMVIILDAVRAGETRRMSLALEESSPRLLQGNIAVRAEADNGDTWNTVLPLHWNSSRIYLSPPAASPTPSASASYDNCSLSGSRSVRIVVILWILCTLLAILIGVIIRLRGG
jgi:hypothetical protein